MNRINDNTIVHIDNTTFNITNQTGLSVENLTIQFPTPSPTNYPISPPGIPEIPVNTSGVYVGIALLSVLVMVVCALLLRRVYLNGEMQGSEDSLEKTCSVSAV